MNRAQRAGSTFIKGATILAVAGLICKFIGAAYRVPLANILGTKGMAYYQIAYPIYNFLLVVSSVGLPTGISRLVAGQVASGSAGGAKRVLKSSIWLLLGIGLVTSSALALSAGTLSSLWLGDDMGRWSIIAISPSLLLVSLMSAFRGYFQGQQRMTPTAFSQIIEQVGKLLVGFSLAGYFMRYGVEYAAAGALAGVTISEALALLCMLVVYMLKGKPVVSEQLLSEEEHNRRRWEELPAIKESKKPLGRAERNKRNRESQKVGAVDSDYSPDSLIRASFGHIVNKILAVAVPVTIGASIMPLVNMIDSAMVRNRLVAGGIGDSTATGMFGLLSGYVQPLISMPSVLTSALAMSLVPAISSAIAARRTHDIHSASQQGIKVAWLIGLPAVVGLMMMAEPIISLLYPSLQRSYVLYQSSSGFTAAGHVIAFSMNILSPSFAVPGAIMAAEPISMITISGRLLASMSVAVLFLSLVQTSTGILQGLGKPMIPVFSLLIGALFKVSINYVLVGMPGINIQGAPIGSIMCYVVASIINIVFITRSEKINLGMAKSALPIVIPTLTMAIVIFLENRFLLGSSRTMTVICVFIAAGVYGIMLLLTGAISPRELSRIPGGKRLSRMLPGRRGGRE